ncbi:hypothetical protein PV327_006191 [Microctonus hyperodae]|nr:hypothetical protein PV327_006191 [Microctonus hyperodae]
MREDVGKFTLYHDYYTKSAVVYFHKRQELDGIINIKYKIQGLPITTLNNEYVIGESKYFEFLKKKVFRLKQGSNPCSTGIESFNCNYRQKIYPELLVAISHDMFQAIEKTSNHPRAVKTISHVLIVYNIVDMMYRYVKSADISLNIAGIVIEGTENEWGFMKKSHSYIESNTINDDIDEYFRNREKYFPRHSYDYIAYNTKFNADHDKIVNWFFIHPCERSVMAVVDCSSSYCLKWSDETENEFKKFFNSPAHCILKNKPQSLFPSWWKPIRLTKLQQCQCYGYKSDFEFNGEKGDNLCAKNLMCKDEQDNLKMYLPFPMNGTPCGKNQVCWGEKCIPYL